jgi:hypothetical protein
MPEAFGRDNLDGSSDRSGHFEITTNTNERSKIDIEDLEIDRALDERLNSTNRSSPPKKFLYRVRHEGFLGFDQDTWVDKIRFELFNRPAIQRSEYKDLAQLLEEIATSIRQSREVMHEFYQDGMRLINFCDKPLYTSLDQLDSKLSSQREKYVKLEELRGDVVRSLQQLTKDGDCRPVQEGYKKQLELSFKDLADVAGRYQSLRERYDGLKRPDQPGPAQRPVRSPESRDTIPSPLHGPTRR